MPCRMNLNRARNVPVLRGACCTIAHPPRQLSIAKFQNSSQDEAVMEHVAPVDAHAPSAGTIPTRPSGGSRMASLNPLLEPLAPHTSGEDDAIGEVHVSRQLPVVRVHADCLPVNLMTDNHRVYLPISSEHTVRNSRPCPDPAGTCKMCCTTRDSTYSMQACTCRCRVQRLRVAIARNQGDAVAESRCCPVRLQPSYHQGANLTQILLRQRACVRKELPLAAAS